MKAMKDAEYFEQIMGNKGKTVTVFKHTLKIMGFDVKVYHSGLFVRNHCRKIIKQENMHDLTKQILWPK